MSEPDPRETRRGRTGPQLIPERVAQTVVDAIALGDEKACERWEISKRTLKRYRAMARHDDRVGQLVQEKLGDASSAWLEDTIRARRATIVKLEELVAALTPSVESVKACTKALATIQDVHVSERVVRHGLGSQGAGSSRRDAVGAATGGTALGGRSLGHPGSRPGAGPH